MSSAYAQRNVYSNRAKHIRTDTTDFDGNLSGTDTRVQTALETLDDIVISPGNDAVSVNSVAVDTTANFKDDTDISFTLTDGGAGGPDDITGTVVDDSHNHTGATLSGIDISDDTNLAVSSPITLTDDTVGFDFSTNNTWTGTFTHQNSADSTTAFQILDADGGTPIFNVDTTNERVGIGTATPAFTLDVNGKAKIATTLGIGTNPTATDGAYISKSFSDPASDVSGISLFPTMSLTANALNKEVYGGITVATASGGAYDLTGGSSGVIGGRFDARNNLTGTTQIIKGGHFVAQNGSTGTATNAYAGLFELVNANAGGTITNAYGVYIDTTNLGTITNEYGVYQKNATADNYFAGNVGIGTTSPDSLLEIQSANNTTFTIDETATGVADSVRTVGSIIGRGRSTTDAEVDFAQWNFDSVDATNGAEDGEMAFRTMVAGTQNTRMVIKGANVGIGTTSPSYKLDIEDTSTTTALYVASGVNGSNPVMIFRRTGALGGTAIGADNVMNGSEADALIFPYNDSGRDGGVALYYTLGSTKTFGMGMDNAGNVGIGTTSPTHDLTIANGATSAGVLAINEDTDDGTNNMTFTVPALAADTDYIWPADDGDADQILSTNGNGTLDWITQGGGAGFWTDLEPNLEPNDDGDGIQINDSGGTDYVVQTHDGTDYNFTSTNTTQYTFDNQMELGNGSDVITVKDILVLNGVGADPGAPSDGSIWHRSDLDQIRVRLNGKTYELVLRGI